MAHTTPNLSIENAIKQTLEYSYYAFLVTSFKEVLHPDEQFVNNWHIKYLCEQLQSEVERIARNEPKTKDIVINIPPRSMKSIITTITLNAWAWIKYPHLKFITASYAGDLAIEHAVETRRLIQSEWYQNYWGSVYSLSSDQNVKSRFTNDKGGSRKSTSVGGTLTGSGADIIIIDDPHKPSEVDSDLTRKSVIDWYKKTVYSRLNDQEIGLRVVVMQRLHEEDLTGILIDNPDYQHICIPAEVTKDISPISLKSRYDNDGLFFKGRFPRSVLDKIKNSSSLEYATQYLQSPSPLEGNLFKERWFKEFIMADLPPDLTWDYYTDTAYGLGESDNSATCVYAMHEGNVYIKDFWVANLTFPEFIRGYLNFLDNSGYNEACRNYFEPKASGHSIMQQLKESITPKGLRLNVIADEPPKESKIARAKGVTPMVESGRVYLLKDALWVEPFLAEIKAFPNAKHDDQVDAFVSALRLCQNKVTITII